MSKRPRQPSSEGTNATDQISTAPVARTPGPAGWWFASHVEVIFQASANWRLGLADPFPTTVTVSRSNAWPVGGQCKPKREPSSRCLRTSLCSFMYQIADRAGAFGTWYLVHHVLMFLWCSEVIGLVCVPRWSYADNGDQFWPPSEC